MVRGCWDLDVPLGTGSELQGVVDVGTGHGIPDGVFSGSNWNVVVIQQWGCVCLVKRSPWQRVLQHPHYVCESGQYVVVHSFFFATDLTKNSPQGYSSPKPEASVILPPEILDKILEYISANWEGRPTLVACALVATGWTGPSQRRLFSTVSIGEGSYQRWMNGVILSGSKTRFLRYVRSMVHSLRDCGEFFSALHNLRSLTLYNLQRIRTEEIPACFSAFRETLTDLSLCDFTTSFSAFVTFVDYFPNVTTLRLGPSRLVPDERPVPPLSRPLRGKVWVRAVRFGCCNLLNRLADLDLEYDELFAEACGEGRGGREIIMETILRISPGTVKYLRLSSPSKGEHLCRNPPLPHFLTRYPIL